MVFDRDPLRGLGFTMLFVSLLELRPRSWA
jgi:hypothetical protein